MSESARLRIVASNLHRGGGVQVGASLIEEIARSDRVPVDGLLVEVSSAVAANIDPQVLRALRHEVVDRRPLSWSQWRRDLRTRTDVALVVFGPAWFPVRGRRRVTGYADVTSVYASPILTGLVARARTGVRGWLSRRQLSRFDDVVVETPAMAQRLESVDPFLAGRVHVVPNSVSAQVLRGRDPVEVPPVGDGVVRLAYITAAYPHKNLSFLPRLADALSKRGVQVRYLLTLSDADWETVEPQLRECSDNLGPVRLEQIRAVHEVADGVVFPSLLEAASATPLEALALGTPLFASDRDFVRAVVGDAATYFDPLDSDSAAESVAAALSDPDRLAAKVKLGRKVAERLPDAGGRATAYLDLIDASAGNPAKTRAGRGRLRRRPRLLIINNMPSYYRTPVYTGMAKEFTRLTGGGTLVAYQVRRAMRERAEWFYTPDSELDFPHRFVQSDFRYLARRKLPPRPGLGLLLRYRPTHVFTAGWDTPLSLAASIWCWVSGARLGIWVESSPLTSKRTGGVLNTARRAFLAPAHFCVVPTEASERYVSSLARRTVPALRLLNPVDLDRLPYDQAECASRAVFLGDLSLRKGFDVYAEAAIMLHTAGIEAHAWGRDLEGLAADANAVIVHPAVPLAEIIPQLRACDVLVIASRVDPAPLTYSEALALGLRVVVSQSIAYSDHARATGGATVADCSSALTLVEAIIGAIDAPAPNPEASREVTPAYFAERVVAGLVRR